MRDTRGASITGLPPQLAPMDGFARLVEHTHFLFDCEQSCRIGRLAIVYEAEPSASQVEMVLLSSKPGIAMLSMLRLRSAEGLGLGNCIVQRASVSFCGARPGSSGQISWAF